MLLPFDVLNRYEKLASDAAAIQRALGDIYTSAPVAAYLYHNFPTVRLHAPAPATAQDWAWAKTAVDAIYPIDGAAPTLSASDLSSGDWIKVAYSAPIHTAAGWMNFVPAEYPGGIPNHPGIVSSMLTTGLVGAGLGYGAGALAENLLPNTWQRGRLRKTMGLVGGLAGMAPGGILGAANLGQGKPFGDTGVLGFGGKPAGDQYYAVVQRWTDSWTARIKASGDTFGSYAQRQEKHPYDIDVDALGRTLWETGADPSTMGMTMGVLSAASQMPGGEGAEPGFVTPAQVGRLALGMGAGYLSGALVGSALGLLTGLPASAQDKLKEVGAYTGLVKTLIPQLFE